MEKDPQSAEQTPPVRGKVELVASREASGLRKLGVSWSRQDLIDTLALRNTVQSGAESDDTGSSVFGLLGKMYVPFIENEEVNASRSQGGQAFFQTASPYLREMRQVFEVAGVFNEDGTVKHNVLTALEKLPQGQAQGTVTVLTQLGSPLLAVDTQRAVYSFVKKLDSSKETTEQFNPEKYDATMTVLEQLPVSPSIIRLVASQTALINPVEYPDQANRANNFFRKLNADWQIIDDGSLDTDMLEEIESNAFKHGLSRDMEVEEAIKTSEIQLAPMTEEEGEQLRRLVRSAKEALAQTTSPVEQNLAEVMFRAWGSDGVDKIWPFITIISAATKETREKHRRWGLKTRGDAEVKRYSLVDQQGNPTDNPRQLQALFLQSIEQLGDQAPVIFEALKKAGDFWHHDESRGEIIFRDSYLPLLEIPLLSEQVRKIFEGQDLVSVGIRKLTKDDYNPKEIYDKYIPKHLPITDFARALKDVSPAFAKLHQRFESADAKTNLLDFLDETYKQLKDDWPTIVNAYRIARFMHAKDAQDLHLGRGSWRREVLKYWRIAQKGEQFQLPGLRSRTLMQIRDSGQVTPLGSGGKPLFLPAEKWIVTGGNGNGKTAMVSSLAELVGGKGQLPVYADGEQVIYPDSVAGIDVQRPAEQELSHFQKLAKNALEALRRGGILFADEPGGTSRNIQVAITEMMALLSDQVGFLISHDGQTIIEDLNSFAPFLEGAAQVNGMSVRDYIPHLGQVNRSSGGLDLLRAVDYPAEFWDVNAPAERVKDKVPFIDLETARKAGFADVLEFALRYFPGLLPTESSSSNIKKGVHALKMFITTNPMLSKFAGKMDVSEMELMAGGIDNLNNKAREEGGLEAILSLVDEPRKVFEIQSMVERVSTEGVLSAVKPDLSPAYTALKELLIGSFLLRIASGEGSIDEIVAFKTIGKEQSGAIFKNLVTKYPNLAPIGETPAQILTDRVEQFLASTINLSSVKSHLQTEAVLALADLLKKGVDLSPQEIEAVEQLNLTQQELTDLQLEQERLGTRSFTASDLESAFAFWQVEDNQLRKIIDNAFYEGSKSFAEKQKTARSGLPVFTATSLSDFQQQLIQDVAKVRNIEELFSWYGRKQMLADIGRKIIEDSSDLPVPVRQQAQQVAVALSLFSTVWVGMNITEEDWLKSVEKGNISSDSEIPERIKDTGSLSSVSKLGIPDQEMTAGIFTILGEIRENCYQPLHERRLRRERIPQLLVEKKQQLRQLQQATSLVSHKRAAIDLLDSFSQTADINRLQDIIGQTERLITDRSIKQQIEDKRAEIRQTAGLFDQLIRNLGLPQQITVSDLMQALKVIPAEKSVGEHTGKIISSISNYVSEQAALKILERPITGLSPENIQQAQEGIKALYIALSFGKLFGKLGTGKVQFAEGRIRLDNAIPVHVIAEKLKTFGVWTDTVSDEDLDRARRAVTAISFDTSGMNPDALLGVGHNAAGKTTTLKEIALRMIFGRLFGVAAGGGSILPNVDGVSYVNFGESTVEGSAFTGGAIDALNALKRAGSSRQLILADEAFSGSDAQTEKEAVLRFLQTAINRGSLPFAVLFEESVFNTLKRHGLRVGVVGFSELYRPRMSDKFIPPNSLAIMRQMGFPQEVINLTQFLMDRRQRLAA